MPRADSVSGTAVWVSRGHGQVLLIRFLRDCMGEGPGRLRRSVRSPTIEGTDLVNHLTVACMTVRHGMTGLDQTDTSSSQWTAHSSQVETDHPSRTPRPHCYPGRWIDICSGHDPVAFRGPT